MTIRPSRPTITTAIAAAAATILPLTGCHISPDGVRSASDGYGHRAPGAPSAARAATTRAGVPTEPRLQRPRPSDAFRRSLRVEATPRPAAGPSASGAPAFDAQRLWGRENDWEPAIAVSPDSGVVHQLTTRYGPSGGGTPDPVVVHRRSLDGGATWEPEQRIFDAGPWQVDPLVETAPGGVVVAAWLHNWDTLVSRSDDDGATWSPPVSLLDAGGPSYTDFPRLVVSPDGQIVHVAFNSGPGYVSTSLDGGLTFGAAVATGGGGGSWFHSGIGRTENGDVHVAAARYTGNNSSSIRMLRSTDAGATWSTTTVDTSAAPPSCALPGCPDIFLGPSVAMAIDSDGTIAIAYHVGAVAGQPHRLYLRTSTDGVTWSPRTEVSAASAGTHHAFPVLAAGPEGGDFRVGWQDNRNGPIAWNTWVRRTTDGGMTWEDEIRVSDQPDGAPYKSANGFRHPYGDYLEIAVGPDSRTHIIWGEGDDYIGPGGTWYTRGLHGEPAPGCPADLNGNATVDIADLLGVLAAWGACPGCPADINGDGDVDITDLLSVLAAWGPCPE